MNTSIEIIVVHADDVDPQDIATRLYLMAKRSAAATQAPLFQVDSFRVGPSVAGHADPVPRVDPKAVPVRCGSYGCHTDDCELWGARCSVLQATVCPRGFTVPVPDRAITDPYYTNTLRMLRSDLKETYSPAVLAKYPHLADEKHRQHLRAKIAELEARLHPDTCVSCGSKEVTARTPDGRNWCERHAGGHNPAAQPLACQGVPLDAARGKVSLS